MAINSYRGVYGYAIMFPWSSYNCLFNTSINVCNLCGNVVSFGRQYTSDYIPGNKGVYAPSSVYVMPYSPRTLFIGCTESYCVSYWKNQQLYKVCLMPEEFQEVRFRVYHWYRRRYMVGYGLHTS